MILDTNAISALAARELALLDLLQRSEAPVLCFVAIGEFRFGLLQSTKPAPGLALLNALTSTLTTLHSDNNTVIHYAAIAHLLKLAGRPIPTNDVWIAALARQHDLPVLSRDRHFDFVPGIRRLDW